jgi:hypothetical protein
MLYDQVMNNWLGKDVRVMRAHIHVCYKNVRLSKDFIMISSLIPFFQSDRLFHPAVRLNLAV